MSFKENKHQDNTDPTNKIISVVDTTGQSVPQASAGIPAVIATSATGAVISVHGVVPGTSVVFDSQRSK
jgi:hypothetical protein